MSSIALPLRQILVVSPAGVGFWLAGEDLAAFGIIGPAHVTCDEWYNNSCRFSWVVVSMVLMPGIC